MTAIGDTSAETGITDRPSGEGSATDRDDLHTVHFVVFVKCVPIQSHPFVGLFVDDGEVGVMRTFVAASHTVPIDPSFSLNDLAGGAGRLDVLCRYLTAAFLLSHDIRTDVNLHLVIRNEVTIECRGDELRYLNPDERSTGALLRTALEIAAERAVGSHPVESTPGIYVRRRGFTETIEEVFRHGHPILLDENAPLMEVDDVPRAPVFILSDHTQFTATERSAVEAHESDQYSLGPVTIHGDHAIAIAHNLCDRAGDIV